MGFFRGFLHVLIGSNSLEHWVNCLFCLPGIVIFSMWMAAEIEDKNKENEAKAKAISGESETTITGGGPSATK